MIRAARPTAHLVALDLAGRRCVVLGGGEAAAGRVAALLPTGAVVTVVAAEVCAQLSRLASDGDITWLARDFRSGDLAGALIAYDSQDGPARPDVWAEAEHQRVLLNTADKPQLCHFYSAAMVRRGSLQIGVSTSGESPHVAAAVRARIESLIGEEWEELVSVVGRARRRLRRRGASHEHQARVYRRLLDPEVRRLMREEGTDIVEASVKADAVETRRAGRVHLVGAGPGDVGLITRVACDLLANAEVVFADALVSDEVLGLCSPQARIVDVGKRAGGQQTAQRDIIEAMIAAARAGVDVVRLKAGDPFIFGRGGEELAALIAAGIEVRAVPGLSAALAAPASAHIPLTCRGVASSVALITGQDRDGKVPSNLSDLARAVDTLVILMPLANLEVILDQLQTVLGREWPAALVAGATTARERVIRAPLGRLVAAAQREEVASPATLIVGRVAAADAAWRLPIIAGRDRCGDPCHSTSTR